MPLGDRRVLADRRPGALRVLYSFPHGLGAAGIGWTAWNQVVELVTAGHEVHLVAASLARPVPGLASLRTTLQLGRLRVPHRAIGRDRAYEYHDIVAARAVRRIRPDVVHGWPLASLRTFDAAHDVGAAAIREAPNTHTAHAFEVVAEECAALGIPVPPLSPHAFHAGHLRREEQEWEAATGILVPSDEAASTFAERGFASERLLRHRYGHRIAAGAAPARTTSTDPLRAIYLGRVEPRKGLHHALRAWAGSTASRNGTFTVYGALSRDYHNYSEYLAPLLEAPGVRMEGFTSDPAAAMATADVLVLPSVEEGSALVTYEAQALGCVPLVSRQAGAVLEHGRQGLVFEARDVDALRGHLDLVDRDRDVLAGLAANSLAAAPDLTWERANRAVEAAYGTALRLSSGSSRGRSNRGGRSNGGGGPADVSA